MTTRPAKDGTGISHQWPVIRTGRRD